MSVPSEGKLWAYGRVRAGMIASDESQMEKLLRTAGVIMGAITIVTTILGSTGHAYAQDGLNAVPPDLASVLDQYVVSRETIVLADLYTDLDLLLTSLSMRHERGLATPADDESRLAKQAARLYQILATQPTVSHRETAMPIYASDAGQLVAVRGQLEILMQRYADADVTLRNVDTTAANGNVWATCDNEVVIWRRRSEIKERLGDTESAAECALVALWSARIGSVMSPEWLKCRCARLLAECAKPDASAAVWREVSESSSDKEASRLGTTQLAGLPDSAGARIIICPSALKWVLAVRKDGVERDVLLVSRTLRRGMLGTPVTIFASVQERMEMTATLRAAIADEVGATDVYDKAWAMFLLHCLGGDDRRNADRVVAAWENSAKPDRELLSEELDASLRLVFRGGPDVPSKDALQAQAHPFASLWKEWLSN